MSLNIRDIDISSLINATSSATANTLVESDSNGNASYDQTTDLQVTNGGYRLTRGNCQATSNGLWVWFHDNQPTYHTTSSYARVWYIQV